MVGAVASWDVEMAPKADGVLVQEWTNHLTVDLHLLCSGLGDLTEWFSWFHVPIREVVWLKAVRFGLRKKLSLFA